MTWSYAAGRRLRIEVLVIDWMLGASVDGIEVAQVLRAGLPRLQMILITGYSRKPWIIPCWPFQPSWSISCSALRNCSGDHSLDICDRRRAAASASRRRRANAIP